MSPGEARPDRRPGWGRMARLWWSGPDLRRVAGVPELAEAERWAGRYRPLRDDPIYGAVRGLAERSYGELAALADGLDRKADDLMKTSAALAAILAAAGRIAGASALEEHPRLILASVGCLVASLLICTQVRTPRNQAATLSIRDALAIADLGARPPADRGGGPGDARSVGALTENQMQAVIAASYDYASVALRILVDWKEGQLRWATRLFVLALFILILALAVAI